MASAHGQPATVEKQGVRMIVTINGKHVLTPFVMTFFKRLLADRDIFAFI